MKTRFVKFGTLAVVAGALTLTGIACRKGPDNERGRDRTPRDMAALFGTSLRDSDGNPVEAAALQGKNVALYFSAHWCPPCRAFTPLFVEAYSQMTSEGLPFEAVFVSGDNSAEEMKAYMDEYKMPWLHIAFDSEERNILPQTFGIRGIPTLVVLDKDGCIASRAGVRDIAVHGASAFDLWTQENGS